MDKNFLHQVLQKGQKAREMVIGQFDHLSPLQLNWKPAADHWSIAQCLDHLVVSDSLYFPEFEKISAGNFQMRWWEKHSPFSKLFGNLLISHLSEVPKRKMKTPKVFRPAQSDISGDIIIRFISHMDQFLLYIPAFDIADGKKTIITSPASKVITYSLQDALTFLSQHWHRHIRQAVKVKENSNFPAS